MNINESAHSVQYCDYLYTTAAEEHSRIYDTNYQCSGLFQGQGQGYFNCSITSMYADICHIAGIIGMELKSRLILAPSRVYIFALASNNCVPSNSVLIFTHQIFNSFSAI